MTIIIMMGCVKDGAVRFTANATVLTIVYLLALKSIPLKQNANSLNTEWLASATLDVKEYNLYCDSCCN
ncbi:hypothetical protein SUGI_0023860 [Cryptomeria japonica]|nr:hypothetical protein SUGI_0023860 [Cryptomeria japonica]